MKSVREYWVAMWRSGSGKYFPKEEHFIYFDGFPLLFKTRREARYYIKREYGYIAKRKDLREDPHNWRMPKVVKITLTMEEK